MVKNSPEWRPEFDPWVRNVPWRREWQPTPVFLPGKSWGQRSLGATVRGVTKSWMWLSEYSVCACLRKKIMTFQED